MRFEMMNKLSIYICILINLLIVTTTSSNCCSHVDDSWQLLQCVYTTSYSRWKRNDKINYSPKLTIVTYLSNGDGQFGISDVLSFGIYQLAILNAYSTNHDLFKFEPLLGNVKLPDTLKDIQRYTLEKTGAIVLEY